MSASRIFWKIAARVLRMGDALRLKIETTQARYNATVDPSCKLLAGASLSTSDNPAQITIGACCSIAAKVQTFEQGVVRIGAYTFIGPDSRVWAHEAIHIGDRCLIAHNVNIIDSNSHSLSAGQRHLEYRSTVEPGGKRLATDVDRKPIRIEDDVWIGHSAIILKGVTIGQGAIVGAGTIVTRDVPPFAIVVGNPMRIVGEAKA